MLDDDWTPKNAEWAWMLEAIIEVGSAIFIAGICAVVVYCLAGF